MAAAHSCTSCGRAYGACATAAAAGQPLPHTIKVPWCAWCTAVFRDNAPDPATGRVHCAGCGAPFPGLAQLVEAGLGVLPGDVGAAGDRGQVADCGVGPVVVVVVQPCWQGCSAGAF